MIGYIFSRCIKKFRGSAIRNSTCGFDSKIESGSTIIDSKIGRHSYCGYDCFVISANIGSFCSIADNVSIGSSTHPIDFVSTSPVFLSHKDSVKQKFAKIEYRNIPVTNIGHDVWIGKSALIKSGVTVGHGAIIGMGSVVTKDVEPYSIVAGNPARLIRYRFDKDTITRLLATKWWELDGSSLNLVGQYVNEPDVFIFKVNELEVE